MGKIIIKGISRTTNIIGVLYQNGKPTSELKQIPITVYQEWLDKRGIHDMVQVYDNEGRCELHYFAMTMEEYFRSKLFIKDVLEYIHYDNNPLINK